MTPSEREQKLSFIFETGKRLRFYMHETVLRQSREGCRHFEDLTAVQMNVALVVNMHQPLSLNDLAERLGVTAPTASVMVDKLVEREVVQRETDPNDRRRVILSIHPKAMPDLQTLYSRFQKAFEKIARRVGDENISHWHTVMCQLSQLLDEENA